MNELTEKLYKELKQEVENARTEADRAKGALDQLVARLKDEFDCKTPAEAKTLLADLEKKKTDAEKAFNKAFESYRKKWKAEDEEED